MMWHELQKKLWLVNSTVMILKMTNPMVPRIVHLIQCFLNRVHNDGLLPLLMVGSGSLLDYPQSDRVATPFFNGMDH